MFHKLLILSFAFLSTISTYAQKNKFSLDVGGNIALYQHFQINFYWGQGTSWAEGYGGQLQLNYQISNSWQFSIGAKANIINQPFFVRGEPLFFGGEGFSRIVAQNSVLDIYTRVGKIFPLKKWEFTPYLGLAYSLKDPFQLSKTHYEGAATAETKNESSFSNMVYVIDRKTYRSGGYADGGINIAYSFSENCALWFQVGYSIGFRTMFTALFDSHYIPIGGQPGQLGGLAQYRMFFSNSGFQSALGLRFYLTKKKKKK